MSKLLVINSSPMSDSSNTRELINSFVESWTQKHGDIEVVNRDIGRNPPPHLDEVTISSFYTADQDRSEAQQKAVALSDQLVDE